MEPIRIPITDVFDLHSIPPRDVKDVVEEYLREAHRLGFKALRIIHGRGIGGQREMVYRTLKMLKTGGLVDELDLMHYGGDQHYYETRLKQEHAHAICLRCGRVEEFFGEPLQRLRKQIESHFGFQVLLARTEVGGYCAHCQTLRARELEEVRLLPIEPPGPPARRRRGALRTRRT